MVTAVVHAAVAGHRYSIKFEENPAILIWPTSTTSPRSYLTFNVAEWSTCPRPLTYWRAPPA